MAEKKPQKIIGRCDFCEGTWEELPFLTETYQCCPKCYALLKEKDKARGERDMEREENATLHEDLKFRIKERDDAMREAEALRKERDELKAQNHYLRHEKSGEKGVRFPCEWELECRCRDEHIAELTARIEKALGILDLFAHLGNSGLPIRRDKQTLRWQNVVKVVARRGGKMNDDEIMRKIRENRCESMVEAYHLGYDDGVRETLGKVKGQILAELKKRDLVDEFRKDLEKRVVNHDLTLVVSGSRGRGMSASVGVPMATICSRCGKMKPCSCKG